MDSFKFPSDIDNLYHFMMFSSFNYERAARGSQPVNNGFNGHVFLPLPANLAVSYSADWSQTELGIAGSMVSNSLGAVSKELKSGMANLVNKIVGDAKKMDMTFSGIRSMKDPTKDVRESITQQFDKLASSIPGHAAGVAGAYAVDNLIPTQSTAIASGLGVAKNPHIAVYYNAPALRTHNFAYKLSAKDQSESEAIKNIIKFFKRAQAPDFQPNSANHLFEYPEEFTITFNNQENLFKIIVCVLRDFTVNYHAQGQPSYFRETRAPVDVDISLTFQEVNILTKKEIDEGF